MPISSPGLGSGLDVNGIVSQLMAIEQQPLLRLNRKEAEVQAEISAYGALKGSLYSVQESLSNLKAGKTFLATKADSTDAGILSASSDTDAAPSSYGVDIKRLAQQHKLGSGGFLASDTFGGTDGDTLTLTVGASSFSLDLSTAMNLSQIQELINSEENDTGVTAGLINGDAGMQTLVLTSGESGYANRVQLSFGGTLDETTFNFSTLNQDAEGQSLASDEELDALLSVDGVVVTRGSNSIDDVVSGLTLELKGAGQASVSIAMDNTVAKKALDEFVKAYNGLREQIGKLGSGGGKGSLIRGLESQLRGVLNRSVPGQQSPSYISELGVTSNSDNGKLELDSEMFLEVMQEDAEGVLAFFSEETGFIAHLDGMLDRMLASGGTIDSMVKGANNRVDGIERRRDAMERRLESIEQRYLRQFGSLDTLMASMSTTSDYLTRQLDALANMINGNNK